MSAVHIYTTPSQPATRFVFDAWSHGPVVTEYSPRKLIQCWNCKRRRWAKNLIAKPYYDCTQFFCLERCKWRSR
jgi:hypothetical protein